MAKTGSQEAPPYPASVLIHSPGGAELPAAPIPPSSSDRAGPSRRAPLPAVRLPLRTPPCPWPLPAPLRVQRAPPRLPGAPLPAPCRRPHSPRGARVSPWRIRPAWGKCLQVYQSSSDCLTAGAGLPASGRLEFQPFSLPNTSLALPLRPTHNKPHSFQQARRYSNPGPTAWGHAGLTEPADRFSPFFWGHSAVILAGPGQRGAKAFATGSEPSRDL